MNFRCNQLCLQTDPEAWNSMYCKNPMTLLGKTCSKIHPLSSTLFQTIIGLKLI